VFIITFPEGVAACAPRSDYVKQYEAFHGLIICYDPGNGDSFKNVDAWWDDSSSTDASRSTEESWSRPRLTFMHLN
jgi:hypothetical protein